MVVWWFGGLFSISLVSIQLVAPASGAARKRHHGDLLRIVSIQLVAPASGALVLQQMIDNPADFMFPFNWLPQRVGPETVYVIQRGEVLSFHSIGCPSEWGRRIFFQRPKDTFVVSIQLVAPASGASHLRIPPVVVVFLS